MKHQKGGPGAIPFEQDLKKSLRPSLGNLRTDSLLTAGNSLLGHLQLTDRHIN